MPGKRCPYKYLPLSLLLITRVFAADISASEKFIAPEVAKATLSCKAGWNEFCEDQKNIQVPVGHKLCQETILASEQTGGGSYEILAKDEKGITVKFSAKGNNDRFKKLGATIILNITLRGVRDADSCDGSKPKPTLAPPEATTPVATVKTASTEKPEANASSTATTTAEPEKTIAVPPAEKRHACACSQWLQADMVYNCLVKGHGRENVSCDTMNTTIQCVATKEACRDIHVESCEQVLGLNQSTSRKRIFVPDSLYCLQQLPK